MWWFAASLRKGGGEGPNPFLLHSTMPESRYLQIELPTLSPIIRRSNRFQRD
jgi:hypothetical protein